MKLSNRTRVTAALAPFAPKRPLLEPRQQVAIDDWP